MFPELRLRHVQKLLKLFGNRAFFLFTYTTNSQPLNHTFYAKYNPVILYSRQFSDLFVACAKWNASDQQP